MAKTAEELESELAECQTQLTAMTNSSQAMRARLETLEAREPADSPKVAELEAKLQAQADRLEETRSKVKRLRTRLATPHPPRKDADGPPAPPPGPAPKKKTALGVEWI
jgi:chromosome segregation ATPase